MGLVYLARFKLTQTAILHKGQIAEFITSLLRYATRPLTAVPMTHRRASVRYG